MNQRKFKGRIENNSWVEVGIYNANERGRKFNQELSNWIDNHLSMVNHQCFDGAEFRIHNPKLFTVSHTLFGENVGIQVDKIPSLFNKKCIFCIGLCLDFEQVKLNDENITSDEKEIVEFYESLKARKENSTVATTKTLFAWWPDLFIPLDRTHNYNSIIFELQTYGIALPINRSNEIQNIDGIQYAKILRGMQFQLRQWMRKYDRNQNDLREIDDVMNESPFLRVIDKNYW